jgi:glyoxylase-like metal-dependent hydrolase (beta-lactamase superfamily II)
MEGGVFLSYSISLLLDDGSVFTGDLTPLAFIGEEDAAVLSASWRMLWERGATRIYPGHGPVRQMDAASVGLGFVRSESHHSGCAA